MKAQVTVTRNRSDLTITTSPPELEPLTAPAIDAQVREMREKRVLDMLAEASFSFKIPEASDGRDN